ncbi:MAG TPA: IclR family transcriptional regulator C-terminal domain-containing protein [Devosia sp.]|jgi:IclR family mhp operon transcriptional activator|nr:IclR family transcriptional regulator C-terminal domain-containing protein [Devosia sp.]
MATGDPVEPKISSAIVAPPWGTARPPALAAEQARSGHQGAGRANSRRGTTDSNRPSYPPVESVRRAFDVLRTLNRLRIGTVSRLHFETGLPKPTVVRMLDTLIADGYVVRDNMCGGYRVTHKVRELDSGYDGIAQIIEASRPCAIDLTRRIKWPVGIGIFDVDAIAVHFWTGTISPWVHTNTLLGHRPNLYTSAMGRAYMAFCSETERERLIARFKTNPALNFDAAEEAHYRQLLARIRQNGFASRAPHTEPRRNITIALPIRYEEKVLASITVSFFITAVPRNQILNQIIRPLQETVTRIEEVFSFMRSSQFGGGTPIRAPEGPLIPDENSLAPH